MKTKPRILIVEDEPIIAADVEMTLEDLGYEVVGIKDNATDALETIKKAKPDLVLLDINLEGDIDGVMLAQDINKSFNIPFIYLTSNADSLTINRVKRTQPAGFIIKPFSEKDLQSNIEIALFSKSQKKEDPKNEFFIRDGSSLIKVNFDDLLFLKADDTYTRLVTIDKNFILSLNLKKVSEKLPTAYFIRIHRSYIINIRFIDRIKEGRVYIDKHKLPIGRSYQDALFSRISKL